MCEKMSVRADLAFHFYRPALQPLVTVRYKRLLDRTDV